MQLLALQHYLAVGAILFVIGLIGFITRRNMIVIFLCTELMFQGVIINLIAFSRYTNNLAGQAFVIFILVIAASVIGGTSLSGGVGTVAGAMLGAVLMQSLQSGMVLLGVDTPLQSIVVGAVLVVAVGFDTVYRRRAQ